MTALAPPSAEGYAASGMAATHDEQQHPLDGLTGVLPGFTPGEDGLVLWRPPHGIAPSGLWPHELERLDDRELELLTAWHLSVAGDDDGRPWWGNAIRGLPLDTRLTLAGDLNATVMWQELERRRCEDDPVYFTWAYGHVQPPEGSPEPFDLWTDPIAGAIGVDSQLDVLRKIHELLRVIVLKARQLGLTWIALHYAVWLMVVNPLTPNARVLALSKHGGDATKLLARARQIMRLLPPFLSVPEETETQRSLTRLKLVGRGSMTSLAGTPEAARMETATFAILDEFAFIRHKNAQGTWTSVVPTLGKKGKAVVVSTGNGPPEQPGDGQAFARLWRRARGQETAADVDARDEEAEPLPDAGGLYPIFLPSSTHPDRTLEWRRSTRSEFLSEEEFHAEYPEDEDEALEGQTGIKIYSPAGISAAIELGRELDRLLRDGTIPDPVGETIQAGVDFGEYSVWLPVWELEGGGVYFPPGEMHGGGARGMSVKDGVDQFHQNISGWQLNEDGDAWVLLDEMRYDSAGVESKHTAVEVIEDDWIERWEWSLRYKPRLRRKVQSPRTHSVSFAKWKNLGIDYQRHLLKRAADGHRTRVMAISPENVEFIRQMRGYELEDDGTGRIKKGDDHGPDAATAGVQKIAIRHLSAMPGKKKGAAVSPRHAEALKTAA